MPVVSCRVCYFHSSALVKLVADDDDEKDGREAVRNLYWNNANMYATSCCVTEKLGFSRQNSSISKLARTNVRYCLDFTNGRVQCNPIMVEDFLELDCGLAAPMHGQMRLATQLDLINPVLI
jgi:hypothetical protein